MPLAFDFQPQHRRSEQATWEMGTHLCIHLWKIRAGPEDRYPLTHHLTTSPRPDLKDRRADAVLFLLCSKHLILEAPLLVSYHRDTCDRRKMLFLFPFSRVKPFFRLFLVFYLVGIVAHSVAFFSAIHLFCTFLIMLLWLRISVLVARTCFVIAWIWVVRW